MSPWKMRPLPSLEMLLSLVLGTSSVLAEESTTLETPTGSASSVVERVDRLEQMVAALAERLERLDDTEAVSPSSNPPEARIVELERRLAAITSELAALREETSSRGSSLALVSTPATNEAAEASQGVVSSPVAPELLGHTDYLPSRSWAGGKLHYGGPELKIVTHGFLDLEYEDAGSEGSRGGVPGFDSHHANLFFDASLRSNLLGHVEVEFEHSDEVEIDQAYLNWALADWMALEVGRFYTPFGIERFTWYSPTNMLVSRPLVYRAIVPGNFYATGAKVSGLFRHAKAPLFTYEISLSNGLGAAALEDRRGSRQSRDNNSALAYSGRGAWVITPHIELGGSFHAQRYDDAGDLGLRFSGIDFSARSRGFELRSEWVAAVVDRELSMPRLEQRGWYGQLAYTIGWDREVLPALTFVTRYDRLDLDRSKPDDDRSFWTLGINTRIYNHFRLKSEYMFAREAGVALDNDSFLLQFVADF